MAGSLRNGQHAEAALLHRDFFLAIENPIELFKSYKNFNRKKINVKFTHVIVLFSKYGIT